MIMNKYYLFVALSAFIWGSMGLFVRLISVSGLIVYFFAALISSVLVGFILFKDNMLKLKKEYLWILIAMAVFNIINNVSYFYSYNLTTIANATFVHYLAPSLIALLAPFVLAEKTERRTWLAVILALIGLFVLVRPNALELGNKNTLGIFLAFISAIGYAFGVMFARKASRYYHPKQILFGQMGFSVLLLSPVILYLKPILQVSDILPLLTLGAVHQGFAVLLALYAIRNIPAQKISIITYLEPVSAVILAMIFLGEIPSIFTLVGGGLILASCYLTVRK